MTRGIFLFIATVIVIAVATLVFAWRSTAFREPSQPPVVDHLLPAIPLTPAEKKRLADLPVLRMGYMPNWYPLSFYSSKTGSLSGVAGDYAALLSKTLGLRLKLVPVQGLAELRQLMMNGEVDIVPLMGPWHDVGGAFVYSKPFQSLPEVFVTRHDAGTSMFTDGWVGKNIVTAAPMPTQGYLRQHFPGSSVLNVDNAEAGLDRVKSGSADAYVGNVSVVDALLRGKYQYSLSIAGQTGVVLPLGVALSKRHAWLMPAIDRSLEAIPPPVRRQILNSWTSVSYNPLKVDWERVARTLLPAVVAAALVLGFLFFAYLRYRREALQRRSAEAKLNAVTRHLPAVVFQARLRGSDDLIFDYVSGNSEQIWGLRPEEMRADPWKFMGRVAPEDMPAVVEEMARAIATCTPFLIEFRLGSDIQRKRGSSSNIGFAIQQTAHGRAEIQARRWIRGNAVPNPDTTGEVVWSGYWVDISDIKQQAVDLQHARDAAEQATESKTQFLAVMSHEIRTPLNGVIGMLELLRRTRMTAQQSSMAATIDESANHLLGLLDEILDLSKIEAGKMVLRLQTIDLRGVVDDVVRLFNATAQSKGLCLCMRVAAEVPVRLEGDSLRLRQMLANLVSNAIKFTHEGYINVDVTLAAALTEDKRAPIRCTVTDTGVGLDKAIIDKLFVPYVQGESSDAMQDAPGGTGLGLSICQRIAQAMGGTINLQNRESGGAKATLEVALPISSAQDGVELAYERVYLSIHDASLSILLREYLYALGYTDNTIEQIATTEWRAMPGAWIAFVCEDLSRVISVVASDTQETVLIDAYPLSWREVQRVTLAHERASKMAVARHVPAGTVSRRVLVAEDHQVSRRLLVHQLTELDCTVVACEDGEQAWQMLDRDPAFDLLVTDVHMPRLDGLSLCRRMRASENENIRRLPVVILSATPLTLPAHDAGHTRVLLKPVKLKDLGHVLHSTETSVWVENAPQGTTPLPGMHELFAQTVLADQAKLPGLIARQDRSGLHQWVHRQAGALATLGYLSLADDAQILEQQLELAFDGRVVQALHRFNEKLSSIIGAQPHPSNPPNSQRSN